MLSRTALRAVSRQRLAISRPPTAIATASHVRYYAKHKAPHKSPAQSSRTTSDYSVADAAKVLRMSQPQTPSSQTPPQQPSQPTQAQIEKDIGDLYKNTEPQAAEESPKEEVPADAPAQPLPDLRHGIPSTFAAEFGKQDASKETAADTDPNITEDPRNPTPPPGSGGRGSGELPKSAYETSTDRRRNKYANWSAVAFVLLGLGGTAYYGRNWETEEEAAANPDAPAGWSPTNVWKRMQARWGKQLSYYTEPTFPKLLPTMDPAPPYTLVLSLNDLLIHSEWSREHGWRTAKRPGLDYFLRYLCQYYEIVVFTDLPQHAADNIIKKLDPLRMVIMWPLFREATRYEKGEYIKDLSYLNRDLSKVILVDTKASHAKLQPENSIILKPWDGKPNDKGLVDLIPFLENVAAMGVADVRDAIKSFEGKDIPTEFARREAIAREQFNKQLEEERNKRPKRSGASWLMGALGMKPQGAMTVDGVSLADGFAQGKMLSDQARERGQKQYELMEKEIRENGEKWLKEIEAEEKRMQEEMMKSMKSGLDLKGWIGGGKPEETK